MSALQRSQPSRVRSSRLELPADAIPIAPRCWSEFPQLNPKGVRSSQCTPVRREPLKTDLSALSVADDHRVRVVVMIHPRRRGEKEAQCPVKPAALGLNRFDGERAGQGAIHDVSIDSGGIWAV